MEYLREFDVYLPTSPFNTSPTTPFQTLPEDVGCLNISSHNPSPDTNLHDGPSVAQHVFRNFRDYKDYLLEKYLPSEDFPFHDHHHHHPYSKQQQEVELSNAHEAPINLQQSGGFIYPRTNQRSHLSNLVTNGGFTSISDLHGSMVLHAKDEQGCQMLMGMMDGLRPEEISLVFSELIGHVKELMMDPFGINVFQKMVEI